MRLLVTVQYAFDFQKAWADSYTLQTKNCILDVEPENFHRSLLVELHDIDRHVEFTKTQSPEPMFRDTKDWWYRQVGWIYRCFIEEGNKTFRGDAWVSIHGVVEDYLFAPIEL